MELWPSFYISHITVGRDFYRMNSIKNCKTLPLYWDSPCWQICGKAGDYPRPRWWSRPHSQTRITSGNVCFSPRSSSSPCTWCSASCCWSGSWCCSWPPVRCCLKRLGQTKIMTPDGCTWRSEEVVVVLWDGLDWLAEYREHVECWTGEPGVLLTWLAGSDWCWSREVPHTTERCGCHLHPPATPTLIRLFSQDKYGPLHGYLWL